MARMAADASRNPWQLYDDLIDGIPAGPTLDYCQTGFNWTRARSSAGGIGMAMMVPGQTRPTMNGATPLIGRELRDVAQLVKSWNYVEATIGLAAINSWYNTADRIDAVGRSHATNVASDRRGAFDVYLAECEGRRVTIVGHFTFIEHRLDGHCDLSILERNPIHGDYPDPACEYILPEQDYVFITGSALVNKTMPRLLSLCREGSAKVVILGPSTTLSQTLFDHGAHGLSAFIPTDFDRLEAAVRGADESDKFDAGIRVDRVRGH